MTARASWLMGLVLAIVGCHAFTPAKIEPLTSPEAMPATETVSGEGRPAYVVRPVAPESPPPGITRATRVAVASPASATRTSVATSVPATRATTPASAASANHLTLAAAQLEKGDEAGACAHLALYLAAHPDHTVVRVHFAELLLRQNHADAAREQFERFEAEAQEQGGISFSQRIRCESRLAHMAEAREDLYEEHLHRGIGLYLLALDRVGQPDDRRELAVEALLFKAASELTQARSMCPDEARPNWYLHEVWSRLGQRQAALRRLKAAESAADFTHLTPAEHRGLQLARQRNHKSRDFYQ